MNESNGVNVCPHCGKTNSLNARYCASCGRPLSVPDEIVICPKCHKPNSSLASFCGHCGSVLKQGAPTKICPRCGKPVDIADSVCSCGFSFGNVSVGKSKRLPYKGGRVAAVIALVFLLVFAYFIFAPQSMRPAALYKLDHGVRVMNLSSGEDVYAYGAELLMWDGQKLFADGFDALCDSEGVGGLLVVGFTAVTALCVVLHVIVCIVRIFSGKRSKHRNGFYLFWGIVTTVWLILWALAYYVIRGDGIADWLVTARSWLVPTYQTGRVIFAIPLYFWFFYIYSCIAKVHRMKEKMG